MSLSKIDDRGYNQIFNPSIAMDIRTKRRCNYILSKMDLSKQSEILEIGCGLGDISYYIAKNTNNKVLGTDLCQPFIDEANKTFVLPNLQFDILDFNKPEKLLDQKFDYIIGNGILHHLYNQIDTTFISLKNLLKDGGKIIFLEPNLVNPYCFLIFGTTKFFRNWANLEPDEKAFTKSFLRKKLQNTGFRNIEIYNKDFLLPVTPSYLITPSIVIGDFIEKIPGLRLMSQSVFLCAEK
ncbi:MAG: class I SAM-dependent methyltransferase [Bacteroidales bacterium]